jgi:hypothetical protein
MPSLKPRPSKIRNLIMPIPSLSQHIAQHPILPSTNLIRRLNIPTTRHQLPQSTTTLHRQLIRRNMLSTKTNSPSHSIPPLPRRQLRKTENQIHTNIRKPSRTQNPKRLHSPSSRMSPIHPPQNRIIKRLHTHTHPIHPQTTQPHSILKPPLHHILRIHLHSKLIKRTKTRNAPHHTRQHRKRQHRRCATSNIKSINLRTYIPPANPNLRTNSISIPSKKPHLSPQILIPTTPRRQLRIKITIRAETPAERNMDINHNYLNINSADPRRDFSV